MNGQDTTTGQDGTRHDQIWLDVATAARRLGITEDAVRKRIHRGKLTAVKVENQWRVVVDTTETGQDGTGPHDKTGQDSEPIETPYRMTEERSIVTDIGQRQLEILRDTLLAPLIEDNRVLRTENGDLREELGKIKSGRDALQVEIERLQATQQGETTAADAEDLDEPSTTPGQATRPWWRFWGGS